MSDSAAASAEGKKAWLTPTILVGAALVLVVVWILIRNPCVKNVDLNLPQGSLKIEFCSPEEKHQLATLLKARDNYLAQRPNGEAAPAYDLDYQERMQLALKYVTGETSVMGPKEEAIELVLAPYLP